MSYDDSDNPAPWLFETGAQAFGLPPGVGSLASSIFSGILGSEGQKDTNAANAALASENRAWQERMSNTAHQREVKDLIAAGLNPMLSALKTGATTPPGAMSRSENPTAAGINAAATAASLENVKAQTEKTKADTDLTRAQIPAVASQMQQLTSSAGHLDAQARNINTRLQAFEDEWANIKEEYYRIKADTYGKGQYGIKTSREADNLLYQLREILPAQAQKLKKEGELLGLKVPEAVQEAAFFKGPMGARAVEFRHAPAPSKFGTGLLLQGGDVLDRGAHSAIQGLREGFEISNTRRIR